MRIVGLSTRRSLVLPLIGLATLAGCAGSKEPTPGNDSSAPPGASASEQPMTVVSLNALIGEWWLTAIGGDDVGRLLPGGTRVPTLRFEADGQLTGHAGVNRLSGRFDPVVAAEGKLTLSPVALTKMAGPPPMMELESRFVRALGQSDAFAITGNELVLSTGGEPTLRFTRAR